MKLPVGARAGYVVAEAGIEVVGVDLVIEQMVQRMLERSGEQLRFKIHREKSLMSSSLSRTGQAIAGQRGPADGDGIGTKSRCLHRGRREVGCAGVVVERLQRGVEECRTQVDA